VLSPESRVYPNLNCDMHNQDFIGYYTPLKIYPTSGNIGDRVNIIGIGFQRNETIIVSFGTIPSIASDEANFMGKFRTNFVVSSQPYGIKVVTAYGLSSKRLLTTTFTVGVVGWREDKDTLTPMGRNPSFSFADYNNDGLIDLAISGGGRTIVYKNTGGKLKDSGQSLPEGSLNWLDYDLDSDLDLAIGGTIYRNDDGLFVNAGEIPTGVCGDIDSDGDTDIVYVGGLNWGGWPKISLYYNENGRFIKDGKDLKGAHSGFVTLSDYNNDSYLDLFVTGHTWPANGIVSMVYDNSEEGFSEVNSDKRIST
jgi:hypothetical protein